MIKQDPQKEKDRQKIIETFYELAQHKTFEQVSLKNILEAANVDRSTFYYHFKGKYEVFEQIQQGIIQNKIFDDILNQEKIDEQTMRIILDAIIKSQTGLSFHCQRALITFQLKVASEMKPYLARTLVTLLDKQFGVSSEHESLATFWSWGIYGIATDCINGKETIDSAVSKLLRMMNISS